MCNMSIQIRKLFREFVPIMSKFPVFYTATKTSTQLHNTAPKQAISENMVVRTSWTICRASALVNNMLTLYLKVAYGFPNKGQ